MRGERERRGIGELAAAAAWRIQGEAADERKMGP
jgi:hypothetical protein